MIADFTKIDSLLEYTDVVIEGTIKESKGSYTTPEGLTFTEYSISVDEIIDGLISNSVINVRQVGGEREEVEKDGKKIKYIAMEENHPLFKIGETYILFLNKNPNEDKYTVGTIGYGAYKISNGMAKNGYPGLNKDKKLFVDDIKKAAKR